MVQCIWRNSRAGDDLGGKEILESVETEHEELTQTTWSDRERAAWLPPEKLRPSEWAEKYRSLSRRQSKRSGQWSNAKAPALVGVMDLAVRPGVREIWIKKAAQVGASEAIRNVLGWCAHLHPDPFLLVLPDEKTAKKIARKRLVPLFEDTQVLAGLGGRLSREKQLTQITLTNGFDLNVAWSGSAAGLASDPFAKVWLDEPDKYDKTGADEAPPAELARVRTRTYEDQGLIIGTCTPTTQEGTISVEFEACPDDAKLYYFVPCPHCGHFQRLLSSGIKWEKYPDQRPSPAMLAALVRRRKAAWYECAAVDCGKRIYDEQKPAMLMAGYWGNLPEKVPAGRQPFKYFVDGHEEGDFPETDRLGMHYPATIDLSAKFYDVAAEWIRAIGDPGKIRQLRNSTLAETYEAEISVTSSNVFADKCDVAKRGEANVGPPFIIPRWAMRVVMTVDTQIDHFYYVVRAWGHAFRSRRIHHGRAVTFDELGLIEQRLWDYDGKILPPQQILMTGIDSGGTKDSLGSSRTDQVYQWCRAQPMRRFPLKGLSKAGDVPIYARRVDYTPPGVGRSPYTVILQLFNAQYFNDLLAAAIDAKLPVIDTTTGELNTDLGEDVWQLNAVNDANYNTHLSNMVRKQIKAARGKHVDRWMPRTEGARVDFRACEYMNFAMAHGPAMCGGLPDPTTWEAMQKARVQQESNQQIENPLTSHKGKW